MFSWCERGIRFVWARISHTSLPRDSKFRMKARTHSPVWARGHYTPCPSSIKAKIVQYSQIDSIGVSGDKKDLYWYQWYDWYQQKMISFQRFYWWICISLRGLRLFSLMWSGWVQGNSNGPLVPIENDVIPVVLLVNMHLIKGTYIIFSCSLAGYRAIPVVHWYQWYDWYQ